MTTPKAKQHQAAASDKDQLLWASREIVKANRKTEDVYMVLTAREHSGPPYEGFESLADGDNVVSAAVKDMQEGSALFARAAASLRAHAMSMHRMAAAPNALDGLDKRTGLRRINAVIAGAHLNGIFRDNTWAPIQKLWRAFDQAGIQVDLTGSLYTKDDKGIPNSKTWKFTVEWQGPKGQPVTVYGQVMASGAGSVQDPLDAYDVVAYAN